MFSRVTSRAPGAAALVSSSSSSRLSSAGVVAMHGAVTWTTPASAVAMASGVRRIASSHAVGTQQASQKKNKKKQKRVDYRLNLPQTGFPMRANASEREVMFQRLAADELYAWQQRERAGAQEFVLHDGPPYANGVPHCGHAMNKILKDMTNRYQLLLGKRVSYTPGWDCHGLPIELLAIQEAGLSINEAREPEMAMRVRRKARKVAERAVRAQASEFRRWGVMGDWTQPYLTMDKGYEAAQLGVFQSMVEAGLIYRGFKPVYWSPSTQTALAESELEYNEQHVSTSAYVSFDLTHLPDSLASLRSTHLRPGQRLAALTWTTTPWTIPANGAIAVSQSDPYVLVEFTNGQEGGSAAVPTTSSSSSSPSSPSPVVYVVAQERVEAVAAAVGGHPRVLASFPGQALAGARYTHPMYPEREANVLADDGMVTMDTGSGVVHTAPAHGNEDFELGQRNRESVALHSMVDEEGRFTQAVGHDSLVGLPVLEEGNKAVLAMLQAAQAVAGTQAYTHSYPYDWRSKKPVILRATQQWFATVEQLYTPARAALDSVEIIPAQGLDRLDAMLQSRTTWCISRQRAWGVPIPVFYDTENDDAPVLDAASMSHVASLVAKHGSDVWWTMDLQQLLPPHLRQEAGMHGDRFRRGTDTMDVWFDSGSSWNAVLRARGQSFPADVYLEGSDQHRGWFQSSLLTSVATQAVSPYRRLVTHGFVLDERGQKMSKSLGNVIEPSLIVNGGADRKEQPAYGADVLRLWVASVDYTRDVNMGDNIIAQVGENMRRIRNTARFMLGNLSDFRADQHAVSVAHMTLLDCVMLDKIQRFAHTIRTHYDDMAYNKAFQAIMSFVTTDLSNLYFERAKDRLYSHRRSHPSRRAAQTVLDAALDVLTMAIAPITCHTAEEIYQYRLEDMQSDERHVSSLFHQTWDEYGRQQDGLLQDREDATTARIVQARVEQFVALQPLQEKVMRALEEARQAGVIGHSQDARVTVHMHRSMHRELQVDEHTLCELFNTSQVALKVTAPGEQPREEVRVSVDKAHGHKCMRCWKYTQDSGHKYVESRDLQLPQGQYELCDRCMGVLAGELSDG